MQAQSELCTLEHRLGELADVDEELRLAKEQEEQAWRNKDTLSNNDPTLAYYEAWQIEKGKIEHETQQNKDALELLKNGTKDARCPTCDQRFTEHSPERRVQHLTDWFQKTLPLLKEQLHEQKRRIDEEKERWKQAIQTAEGTYKLCREKVVSREKVVVCNGLCLAKARPR